MFGILINPNCHLDRACLAKVRWPLKINYMHMKLNSNLFKPAIIGLLSLSCEAFEGPVGPAGPSFTGDLFGAIQTFDEFGNLSDDHSGVQVAIEGTNPLITTLTDSDGRYYLEDLTTGTYNLVFTKDNFQTQKIFSQQFVGGGLPTYITRVLFLSAVSTTSILSFSISITEEGNPDTTRYSMVKVERSISPESTQEEPRQVRVFLSTSPEVSPGQWEYRLGLGTGNTDIIRLEKLPGGTTFYAIMYPEPGLCNPFYDPFLEVYNYSCYGTPTEVISFVVP